MYLHSIPQVCHPFRAKQTVKSSPMQGPGSNQHGKKVPLFLNKAELNTTVVHAS